MRLFLTVIAFFVLSFISLKSQTKELKGEVRDASGGLSGVVVTVTTESENDVLAYAITDNEGKFLLKNVDMEKGKFVHARLMGYAPKKIPIEGNKTDYVFLLTEESIQLNEVLIKAPKITGSGDTTRYLASSFAKENDITLGDVLKRMPGIQVSDGGRIKYQGKDISDFYVEGSNIMGGKYPIAVNSIHQADVGSVEVIENHQSVKLFEDILFSNNTALNITLKERAKNRWVGLLNLGGGIPAQWSADINAMRFAPKVKMLDTYKGNNTGNNVSSIGKTIFDLSDETEEDAREIISMRSTRNPFLEDRKTLSNKSHLLSLNNQVPLSKTFMLTPQLDIGRSTFDNNILEEKNYFLEGGKTFNISTQETALIKQWDISPTLRLDANTRKLYFSNKLSSNIVRKENSAFVTGTYPNRENGNSDYANIRNDLNAMFRIGKKVIGIKSVISWSRRPQDMDIVQNETKLHQHILTSAFNSNTSATQSFAFGRATLSLDEGYSFSRQKLQSTLSGLQNINGYGDFENDFDYRKASLYVKPSLYINWGVFKTTISMPVNYNINEYADKQEQETYTKNRWLLSPSASASWIANKKYTVSLNSGWKKLPENSDGFFSSPMLSSFPFIQTGFADFQNAETSNAGILVRYKNILKGLFWNASYNRSWRHGDLMTTQDFEDGYIVNGFTRDPHTAKSDNVLGSISYMLDFMKGGASLRGVYSHSDSYFVQKGERQYSVSSMKQLSLNVYSSPLRILDIDYTFSFTDNAYRLEGKNNSSTNTVQQKLLMTFIPTEKMNVAVTGNHYYNTLENGNKNTFLLDASANYKFSSKWSFRLSAQNILNQNTFSYISYTDMASVERTYKIRPLSLLLSVITHF